MLYDAAFDAIEKLPVEKRALLRHTLRGDGSDIDPNDNGFIFLVMSILLSTTDEQRQRILEMIN